MVGVGQSGHLGGSCSTADIVAALYFSKMRHDPVESRLAGSRPVSAEQGARGARPVRGARRVRVLPGGRDGVREAARRPLAGPPRPAEDAGHRGQHRIARPGDLDRLRHGRRAEARRAPGACLLHPRGRRDGRGPDLGGGDGGLRTPARQPGGDPRPQRADGHRADRAALRHQAVPPRNGGPSAGTSPKSTATTSAPSSTRWTQWTNVAAGRT